MLNAIKGKLAKGYLGRLAGDHDLKTTVLGGVLAALVADQTIDWSKLIQRDPDQLVKAAAIATLAAIHFYTNRKPKAQPDETNSAPVASAAAAAAGGGNQSRNA